MAIFLPPLIAAAAIIAGRELKATTAAGNRKPITSGAGDDKTLSALINNPPVIDGQDWRPLASWFEAVFTAYIKAGGKPDDILPGTDLTWNQERIILNYFAANPPAKAENLMAWIAKTVKFCQDNNMPMKDRPVMSITQFALLVAKAVAMI